MEAEIQRIRELEKEIFSDIKNANNLVEIRKIAAKTELHKDVRIAAIHAFRRIIVTLAEDGKIAKPTGDNKNKAVEKFYSWIVNQYQEYLQLLCKLLGSAESDWSHELVVRTTMEVYLD